MKVVLIIRQGIFRREIFFVLKSVAVWLVLKMLFRENYGHVCDLGAV